MNQLPESLLHKPFPLTADELSAVYGHPLHSRDAIEKSDSFAPGVEEIVVQAHERMDGSGYSHGLSGDAIQRPARILAVANMYAAMISPRPYRPAMDPCDAMVVVVRSMYHKLLDRDVARALVESLSVYPVGPLVRLETGEIAKVVAANDPSFFRPVVRVLLDPDGERLERPYLVDVGIDEGKIMSPVSLEDHPEPGGMVGF